MGRSFVRVSTGIGLLLVLLSTLVFAQDAEQQYPEETEGWSSPVPYILFAGALLTVLAAGAIVSGKKLNRRQKKAVFLAMVIPVILSSLYLAGHTVYINVTSVTKGPIHWHADFQVWACGERLDLVDPRGLSNKIGTSLFHEHNDNRIHVEGVVSDITSISLGNFFRVIGGKLTSEGFVYPVEGRGVLSYTNGQSCATGLPGYLQVYVNGKRVIKPEYYVLGPETNVPPGDCIIVEFGAPSSETTTRLCESWEVHGASYTEEVANGN